MSCWGTWPDLDSGEIHVVPCDEQKNVLGGHTKTRECFCKPVRDEIDPLLVVHFDKERGGFNA